jgi:hypothetical protein
MEEENKVAPEVVETPVEATPEVVAEPAPEVTSESAVA